MMKVNVQLENAYYEALMCRELKSITRPIHGYKVPRIRRDAHNRARRTMKILRRVR